MEFKVVEIPTAGQLNGPATPLVNALIENAGKSAIELEIGERDPNSMRKGLRASLVNRGVLRRFHFKTKVFEDRKVLLVWLEPKPGTTVPATPAQPETKVEPEAAK